MFGKHLANSGANSVIFIIKMIYFTVENDISEDVILSVFIALNLLIGKAGISVLNQMYNECECKNVGYLIYICTKIIKNEKMNILRFVFLQYLKKYRHCKSRTKFVDQLTNYNFMNQEFLFK